MMAVVTSIWVYVCILFMPRYTFEVAPVFTLMEQVILRKMCQLVGYDIGDGIFCPGLSYQLVTSTAQFPVQFYCYIS